MRLKEKINCPNKARFSTFAQFRPLDFDKPSPRIVHLNIQIYIDFARRVSTKIQSVESNLRLLLFTPQAKSFKLARSSPKLHKLS